MAKTKKGPVEQPSAKDLADRLRSDRLARNLSWKEYGEFLGVAQATVYRLAMGKIAKPHETTVHRIMQRIGGSSEVVPVR